MIGHKGANSGLAVAVAWQVFGDAGLRNLESALERFTLDAPQWVLDAQLPYDRTQRFLNLRSPYSWPAQSAIMR